MATLADLMNQDRRAKLAREMTHQTFTPYQPSVSARQGIGQWAQGVAERSSPQGMLSALASEANRYRGMPINELAGQFGASGGGLVGMFAGKGAKTANLAALAKAEQIKSAGGDGGKAMSIPKPEGRWFDSLSPNATEAEKLAAYGVHQKAIEQYNIDRANELIGLLDKHGIKTSGTGIQESPFSSTTNAVGGASLYMNVPGYGTVRFSDHIKTGTMGARDNNFNDAQSAYESIKNSVTNRANRHLEVQALRDEIGIGDNPQANIDAIKKWLKENPQPEGLNKPFAWKDRLLLSPGQPGSWLPNRLDIFNPFESAKTE